MQKEIGEPEPGANQYRELSKMLATEDGTANFKLTYNGSRFQIYPTDADAQAVLQVGNETSNVAVSTQALIAAFNEMGLTLEDLDAIYVHMDNKTDSLFA